ncbi:protein NRT1/ PTR FAMILY 2.8-like [Cucurbita pepo subsp. pepo]|uniref:protein NRT1/ PTR FAMILY 2.8-like n=1 Tax=Cucurbita pepo subsp. pepo TaxID=3664 RepID=UPI000C9D602C|nr:protein NRT1/ PTR FAMILY 2.8-like [Cucurbita pepo subsp. pepo]
MDLESPLPSSPSNSHHRPPPPRRQPGGWRAVKYIIGNESFEKLSSMSLISNITVYLSTKYNLNGIYVVNVVNIWSGTSNVATLAGAFIADTCLGRYRTLLYGSIASFLGMGAVTLTAIFPQLRPSPCNAQNPDHCPQPHLWQLLVLFTGLGLLSVGAGGIRPCNVAFGADQFDTTTEKGKSQLESFFNWWYLSFTVALLIALTGVVYVQTNISWTLGFAIPTICFFFSITIFLLGRHTYIMAEPRGSMFSDMARVIIAACRKGRYSVSSYSFYDPPMADSSHEEKLVHTERFKWLDKAAFIVNPDEELDEQGKPKNPWRLCSLQQVEGFKCLVSIIPIWISGIGCFVVFNQPNTFGILQALQSNRSIGTHFKFPPGWMHLAGMISLSIWIIIYERVFIKMAKKITGKERRLTMKQRITIGIILSIVCMVVSGIVERYRREAALKNGSFISPISFAFLLPQHALTGLMEAFALVAIMEFFTMHMPEHMRTVAGAIFFLTLSVASYLSSLIVNLIQTVSGEFAESAWVGGHDLNENRLDYYYFTIAIVGALNLLYFVLFASRFVTSYDNKVKLMEDLNRIDL